MVVIKNHFELRSSQYLKYAILKKYRIFFIFGIILLCTQVYLAFSFLSLENNNQYQNQKLNSFYKDQVIIIKFT